MLLGEAGGVLPSDSHMMPKAVHWLSIVSATQTDRGIEQAQEAGEKIKKMMDSDGNPYKLYFYMWALITASTHRPCQAVNTAEKAMTARFSFRRMQRTLIDLLHSMVREMQANC